MPPKLSPKIIDKAAALMERIGELQQEQQDPNLDHSLLLLAEELASAQEEFRRMPAEAREKARVVVHYRRLFAEANNAYWKLQSEADRRPLSAQEDEARRDWLQLLNDHRRSLWVALEGEISVRLQEQQREVQMAIDELEGGRKKAQRGFLTSENQDRLDELIRRRSEISEATFERME